MKIRREKLEKIKTICKGFEKYQFVITIWISIVFYLSFYISCKREFKIFPKAKHQLPAISGDKAPSQFWAPYLKTVQFPFQHF